MSDHTTRRDTGIRDTLDAIDSAVDDYIEWDGDSADAMEWFAPGPKLGPVQRFEINMGTEGEPDWQPVSVTGGFEFEFADDTDSETISTVDSWSVSFAAYSRPFKPRGWRGWMHRLGLVRSPHCTLLGIPFGFRNGAGIPSPATKRPPDRNGDDGP